MEYFLKKSEKPSKKFKLIIKRPSGREKNIHFGSKQGKSFIDHNDEEKKKNWIARHKVRENWNEINPGSLSRFILWSGKTLEEGIKNFEKKFNINIIKKL